jgi:hypothetical protein
MGALGPTGERTCEPRRTNANGQVYQEIWYHYRDHGDVEIEVTACVMDADEGMDLELLTGIDPGV